MKTYFFCCFLVFFSSCNARDPNPEQKDVIYLDFKKELALVDKTIDQSNKELEDRKNILKKVVPQTGQIKSIEKKVFDTESEVDRLNQQRRFFEIKLEQRRQLINVKIEASFHGGPAWPDLKEVADYEAEIKLQRAKLKWDKEKGIVKKVPRGTNVPEELKAEASH